MSLFNDKDFLTILAAVAAKEKLKKMGQVAPTANVYDNASALLGVLEKDIDPSYKIDMTRLRGGSSTAAAPDAKDLRTLGDFARWAATNQITWNQKRIAYLQNEKSTSPGSNFISINALELDRTRGDNRVPQAEDIWVDPKALSQYLVSIRDNEAMSNKVLEVMLKTLINDFNTKMSIADSNYQQIRPRPIPSVSANIPDDAVIDGFNNLTTFQLDLWDEGLNSAPFFRGSSVKLLGRNIKTVSAFQAWLGQFKTFSRTPPLYTEYSVLSAQGDPCKALHILYKRAKFLQENAEKYANDYPDEMQDYSKYADAYMEVVKKIKDTLKDPETGNACDITTPTVSSKPISRPSTEEDDLESLPKGMPGDLAGRSRRSVERVSRRPFDEGDEVVRDEFVSDRGVRLDKNLLTSIVSSLPLDKSMINFNLISTFLSKVRQLGDDELDSFADEIIRSLMAAKNNTAYGKESFPLVVSYSRDFKTGQFENPFLADMKGPNHMGSFCNYMGHLSEALKNILELISLFRRKYNMHLKDYHREAIVQQIGTPGSPYNSAYGFCARKLQEYQQNFRCPITF